MRSELAKYVVTQLPAHFIEENPRFIALLQLYYKWLYRKEGMSRAEIDDFLSSELSWKNNLSKFVSTSDYRFFNSDNDYAKIIMGIVGQMEPGNWSNRVQSQYLLEREYELFVTADEEVFTDNDLATLESPFMLDWAIETWSNRFNHKPELKSNLLDRHSEVSLLRVLKHLYSIKGTKKCVELFFNIYFNEQVEVFYPKFDICVIDDNCIPDSNKRIRDDNIYQEYSYVIYVSRDPELYMKTFEEVYMKNFHPGGFKVTILKKT